MRTVLQGQPPIQTEFPKWVGNPEGVYFAPCGYVLMDYDTGDMYRKTTPEYLSTGWVVTLLGTPVTATAGISKSYNTFADVKAETILVNQGFYWLRGGFALHDFNGGGFTYNAASFAPDDGYNTLIPDSKTVLQPGRFERD